MDNYRLGPKLGQGKFGSVFLVESADGVQSVLKAIKVDDVPEKEVVAAFREAKLLRSLHHPFCVQYNDSFEDDEGHMCLITEHCTGGDLSDFIQGYDGPIPEDTILELFCELCLAVKYLHKNHILHRDLKTKNIFLTGLHGGGQCVKLGDFGISRVLDNTRELAFSIVGTPYYMAPELVRNGGVGYSSPSDIWSLGCVLHEMCTKKHAFTGKNMISLANNILEAAPTPIPECYSRSTHDLIRALLQKNPQDRPSIDAILMRPSIKRLADSVCQSFGLE